MNRKQRKELDNVAEMMWNAISKLPKAKQEKALERIRKIKIRKRGR